MGLCLCFIANATKTDYPHQNLQKMIIWVFRFKSKMFLQNYEVYEALYLPPTETSVRSIPFGAQYWFFPDYRRSIRKVTGSLSHMGHPSLFPESSIYFFTFGHRSNSAKWGMKWYFHLCLVKGAVSLLWENSDAAADSEKSPINQSFCTRFTSRRPLALKSSFS